MDESIANLRIHVPDFLTYKMGHPGRTISQMRENLAKHVPLDVSQKRYEDMSVWYSRAEILDYLATKMKIAPHHHGPNRKSPDFYNMIDQEIAKLRKKNIIIDWSAGNRIGIFRIAPDKVTNEEPVMDYSESVRAIVDTNYTIKEAFVSILTKGKKSNTYKFALARALIEYCQEHPKGDNLDIPYSYFARKFFEYYWHQVCRYRIKQDFKPNSEPRAMQVIRSIYNDSKDGFKNISEKDKQKGENMILKTVFGHAKVKTSIVIPRFQNIPKGRGSTSKEIFYEYDDDSKILRLKPEAFDFFKSNHKILSMAVLSEWAKFLEKINKSLPNLVAKIGQDEFRRKSLGKYRKIYLNHTCHCFYCGDRLESGYIEVDHFLPWSYIFEDQAWNLVLACKKCNGKKSASLPQEEFRTELLIRNRKLQDNIRELEHSLMMINTRLGWEREIENHYTICKDYGFATIKMP